jgi:cobalt/nickel transport system permease protein
MHIPGVFIPIPEAAVYWIITHIFLALTIRWVQNEMNDDTIPLIAILTAGIFALQTFNHPTTMRTNDHLVGGALAAIVLGSPFAAGFILTLVLIIQAYVFGDRGITTMGANIINMGVIGRFVRY